MSEEPFTLTEEVTAPEQPSKIGGFKRTCLGIGLVMIITFLSRHLATVVSGFLSPFFVEADTIVIQVADLLLSLIFLNLIPIISAYFILIRNKNVGAIKEYYGKPKYFGSALAMTPAIYAISIGLNVLVVWISSFFRDTSIGESLNALENIQPPDLPSALVMLFQLVIMAPVLEELWFRGIVLQSLRPYGNGFAIFVSGMLFGITHANLQQGLYATAIGIALGYIAVSTKSIVTTTVIHAIINSISGIMMVLMTFPEVQKYMSAAENMEAYTPEGAAIVFLGFMIAVLLLLVIGVIMAVYKLVHIRRYRVEKVWDEVSSAKRWGIFLTRITVIIGFAFAIEQMFFGFITGGIVSLFSCIF